MNYCLSGGKSKLANPTVKGVPLIVISLFPIFYTNMENLRNKTKGNGSFLILVFLHAISIGRNL